MKFVKTSISKIKKGDFIWYISPRTPYLKLYGVVRVINRMKIIQSKNMIQSDRFGRIFPIKPSKPTRFWKTEIQSNGSIQKLVD